MFLRPAHVGDIPDIIALTRATRQDMAEWSPRYFRPHPDADARHEAWLAYLVGAAECDTRVLVDADGGVVGFVNVIRQPKHWWADDLAVADSLFWNQSSSVIAAALDRPWVTCVPRGDVLRSSGLQANGLTIASTYWAVGLHTEEVPVSFSYCGDVAVMDDVPRHTFGGRAFDPVAPGALVVADERGLVVGSPGMFPPLFDPGGSTTVIDRIEGADRASLLETAIQMAAARGDAQLIVVTASSDDELDVTLREHGFVPEVDVFLLAD